MRLFDTGAHEAARREETHPRMRKAPPCTRRQDHEAPAAIARDGWRFHHLGLPTTAPRPDEYYLASLDTHVAGFETSPFGVQWMRFGPNAPVHELVRRVPHLAFEVDDLDAAIEGRRLLGSVTSPSAGVRVAMIVDDGAPIELLEFAKQRKARHRAPRLERPSGPTERGASGASGITVRRGQWTPPRGRV